jgi:spore maturation protein CgeB
VGTINNFCLETSYANAGKALGHEIFKFDPNQESKKYIRLGKFGQKIHDFIFVEVWTRKMNRELIIFAKEKQPDIIFIFGGSKILYGSLITIQLILPSCKIAWVWPDTPMNLNHENLNNASLFDLSATYSSASVEPFRKMGFVNVHWVPLAGDKFLHWMNARQEDEFDCDISFVGMWRPERERIMNVINEHFGHLKIEIHGNYWQRNCSDKNLLKKWKGNGFYAKDLAAHFNRSRININVIDDTNFPAANMRFFEIPTSGGLQIASPCPEFANEFVDKKSVIYFENETDIVDKIKWVLSNKEAAHQIRISAQALINSKHNYTLRLSSMLSLLNNQ